LKKLGFSKRRGDLVHQGIVFSPFTIKKRSNNKDVVIALNKGYLCSYTVDRILKFRKTKDINKDGYKLAKYFLEAGIEISRENFVGFYQQL